MNEMKILYTQDKTTFFMPGIARMVAPGYPYHVTKRGNYQQPVFDEEDDFRQYLQWLKEYAQIFMNICAYCLIVLFCKIFSF